MYLKILLRSKFPSSADLVASRYFFMYAFLRPVVIIDHVVVNEGGGAASRSVLNNGGESLNYELRQLQSV